MDDYIETDSGLILPGECNNLVQEEHHEYLWERMYAEDSDQARFILGLLMLVDQQGKNGNGVLLHGRFNKKDEKKPGFNLHFTWKRSNR